MLTVGPITYQVPLDALQTARSDGGIGLAFASLDRQKPVPGVDVLLGKLRSGCGRRVGQRVPVAARRVFCELHPKPACPLSGKWVRLWQPAVLGEYPDDQQKTEGDGAEVIELPHTPWDRFPRDCLRLFNYALCHITLFQKQKPPIPFRDQQLVSFPDFFSNPVLLFHRTYLYSSALGEDPDTSREQQLWELRCFKFYFFTFPGCGGRGLGGSKTRGKGRGLFFCLLLS